VTLAHPRAPLPRAPHQRPTASAPPAEEPATGAGREAVLVGYGVANEDGLATRTHRRKAATPVASASAPPVVRAPVTPGLSPRSTPPVRLYAKQHGIDLATLTGSGRDGLITRHDVEQALSPQPTARRETAPMTGPTTTSRFVGREIESWSTGPKEERIPVKGVLRSMSEAMVQSASAHRTPRCGFASTQRGPLSYCGSEEAPQLGERPSFAAHDCGVGVL